MIGIWLEEHGSELDALIAKIGKETGRLVTVEGVACDMLDQALEVFPRYVRGRNQGAI